MALRNPVFANFAEKALMPFRFASFAALLFPTAVFAQRLPSNAVPTHYTHYTLALAPDIAKAVFTGEETIDLTLAAPSPTITLNAVDIAFQSVAAGSETAKVSEDKDKQQVTFTFPKPLPAGPQSLRIRYSGTLNDKLKGFYLSKTSKRNYAVTQFEATDARRAFPSFDEPAFKATYTVALTVDSGDTAISNTNIVKDTPAGAGKHTLSFATTPKMSTYLVAFLVGDFQCTKGEADGIPIRACATPDKLALTPYAVKAAEFVLHYYNTYFGIKYPMPKLDMVGIPDFEAGAMENFGAITYRETDFLIDEQHSSLDARERVAQVVAHEMAHQWFGDMVTMQWWNNVWLNEGFASWMENKPVAAWHPEWHIPEQEAASLDDTLNLDAQAVTRAIRAEADTPDEITEMFDGITYQKGAAILGMLESYLGEEKFREGVHNYLQAHLFSNATAEDFWEMQTRTSGKPVDAIMQSFVGAPGVPLLQFSAPAGGKVSVAQSRFFLSPSAREAHASEKAQSWTIPVCLKTAGSGEACRLLTRAGETFPTASGALFFANARAKGYYRTQYPPELQGKLAAGIETALTPSERISLLGDGWAEVRSGKGSIGGWLDLAAATHADPSAEVTGSVLADLRSIDARLLADGAGRDAFAAWVRATYKPELDKLGEPRPGEQPDAAQRRADLFAVVGGIGKDPATIAAAKELAARSFANPDSVDPTLSTSALVIAAQNGDAALFDRFQNAFETDPNPQRSERALHFLATFEQPALTDRAMAYAASSKVRNQDATFVFATALRGTATRETAWKYIKANWPAVSAQLTGGLNDGSIVRATGAFCSEAKAAEVKQFFTEHPVPASARSLDTAQAQIKDCAQLRAAQELNLQTWLNAHAQQVSQVSPVR